MKLEEIKAAIPSLSIEERAEVARCLHEWEDDEWDQRMKEDLATGKLNALLARMEADVEHGRLFDPP